MVDFNVNLPQNGTIWIGKLSWEIVLIALFDVGCMQYLPVAKIKEGRWQEEDYSPTVHLAFPLSTKWIYAAAVAASFTDIRTSVARLPSCLDWGLATHQEPLGLWHHSGTAENNQPCGLRNVEWVLSLSGIVLSLSAVLLLFQSWFNKLFIHMCAYIHTHIFTIHCTSSDPLKNTD